MKRTNLQRTAIEDQRKLNTDELSRYSSGTVGAHPAGNLLKEPHSDPKVKQRFKRFVRSGKMILCLAIMLIGCLNENDKITDIRDEFIGDFCGRVTGQSSWNSVNTTIRKSETDSNKIILDNFIGADTVEATIDGYNLVISETTYRGSETSSAGYWGETYYYTISIAGNGTLDINSHSIQLNITLTKTYDTGEEQSIQSSVTMFNSSKYSYVGTFTGDSITVTILPYNDSLLLSISFQNGLLTSGWKDFKASEKPCGISFSVDSITDISSGEWYRLGGGANKYGDSLRFSLTTRYHNYSPIYFYDFTVAKVH